MNVDALCVFVMCTCVCGVKGSCVSVGAHVCACACAQVLKNDELPPNTRWGGSPCGRIPTTARKRVVAVASKGAEQQETSAAGVRASLSKRNEGAAAGGGDTARQPLLQSDGHGMDGMV